MKWKFYVLTILIGIFLFASFGMVYVFAQGITGSATNAVEGDSCSNSGEVSGDLYCDYDGTWHLLKEDLAECENDFECQVQRCYENKCQEPAPILDTGELEEGVGDLGGATSCGDGVVDSWEGCDDGNTNSGDGCSNVCQIENGWDCVEGDDGTSVCEVIDGCWSCTDWSSCSGGTQTRTCTETVAGCGSQPGNSKPSESQSCSTGGNNNNNRRDDDGGTSGGGPVIIIYSPQATNYDSVNIPLRVGDASNIATIWKYNLNGEGKIEFIPNTTIVAKQGENQLTVIALISKYYPQEFRKSVTFSVNDSGVVAREGETETGLNPSFVWLWVIILFLILLVIIIVILVLRRRDKKNEVEIKPSKVEEVNKKIVEKVAGVSASSSNSKTAQSLSPSTLKKVNDVSSAKKSPGNTIKSSDIKKIKR